MNTIITLLISFVKDNPVISFIIALSITLFVWIYKENKSLIQKESSFNYENIKKKIQILGQLESAIALYRKKKDDKNEQKLYEILGLSNSFLSNDIRQLVIQFYNDNDIDRLNLILLFIQSELTKLQKQLIDHETDNKTIDFTTFIFKVLRPAEPIFYLLLLILFILIQSILWIKQESIWGKVNIFFGGLSLIIGFVMFIWFIKTIIDGTLRIKTKFFIISVLLISLLPLITLFFAQLGTILFMGQIGIFIIIINYMNKKKIISKI